MMEALADAQANPGQLVMYFALFAANVYFLFIMISYVRKIMRWESIIAIVESVELKNVGDSISSIPTIGYVYKDVFYSSRPTGSFKADHFLVDAPIEILVNPNLPSRFSIKNNETLLVPAAMIALINIPAIKALLNMIT